MAKEDDKKAIEQPNVADNPVLNTPPQNTEEARKQSEEMLRVQEQARPEPSQEEADEIRERAVRSAGAEGAAPYATRDAKAK